MPLAPSLRVQIAADIACIGSRDPAARGKLEALFTYPGVHAVVWRRIGARLWRRGWRSSARVLPWLARFLTNVDIHPGAAIGERFFIDHGAGVVIGETAVIGANSVVMEDVPEGATVVGVPGKVARALTERRPSAGGRIDLEHHLMPNRVGEAFPISSTASPFSRSA